MTNMRSTAKHRPAQEVGFSLVEILVGLAIGMFGILIVLQVFSMHEGQKRSSTSTGDAQSSALVSLTMIEREILSAGFGSSTMQCSTINAYNSNFTPNTFTLSGRPLLIEIDTPAAGSDRITISRGSSALGNVPTTIQNDMPNSSAILRVNYGADFKTGDLVLISQPPQPCSLVQLTQDGQLTGTGNVSPPIGTQWNLQHNPTSPWNPPGGSNIFPPSGYTTGATVFNMGQIENFRYYVENGNLMYQLLSGTTTADTTPRVVADNVIAMRARYGRDTNADGYVDAFDTTTPTAATANQEIVAAQIAIVVRASQLEREMVSPAKILPWADDNTVEINLSNEQRRYRYRTYSTIVPLRNIIWNN